MKTKTSKKTTVNQLLNLWSKTVKMRDGNKCVVCGRKTYLNAHHILPKSGFGAFMLDVNNGITLCPKCHALGPFSAHLNGLWFSEWLRNHRYEQYRLAHKRILEDKRLQKLK